MNPAARPPFHTLGSPGARCVAASISCGQIAKTKFQKSTTEFMLHFGSSCKQDSSPAERVSIRR
jgi:hypothetical protein